jgi:hypothetical protein
MGTLTIRLPEDKHARLRRLARHRQVSMNKLMEELSTAALAEFDAETRFLARAARGSVEEGLRLLDRLDRTADLRRRSSSAGRSSRAGGSQSPTNGTGSARRSK